MKRTLSTVTATSGEASSATTNWRALDRPPASIDYIVLRPARQIAIARATERTGDRDLTDPEPITAMYDAFEDLGSFERHVLDTAHQDPAATLALIIRSLDSGAFALTRASSCE